MARLKKGSKVLADFEKRLAGIATIGDQLDLGGGVTSEAMDGLSEKLRESVSRYNGLIAECDAARAEVLANEKSARDLAARALAGVAVRYGRDSMEYQRAGGRRMSDRGRPGERKSEGAKASDGPSAAGTAAVAIQDRGAPPDAGDHRAIESAGAPPAAAFRVVHGSGG